MPQTRDCKEYRLEIMIILFAFCVLAMASLVVAVRLYREGGTGFVPNALVVFSVFGLVGGVTGLIVEARQLASPPPPPPAPPAADPQPESIVKVRLGRFVDALEEQNRSLRADKAELQEEVIELKGEIHRLEQTISQWQQRSVEMFRLMERVLNSDNVINEAYIQAMLRTKKHFAGLVAPMGVAVIEPERGDRFDDQLHQAVEVAQDASLEPWTVTACLEWGYTINGQVERPAGVIISRTE